MSLPIPLPRTALYVSTAQWMALCAYLTASAASCGVSSTMPIREVSQAQGALAFNSDSDSDPNGYQPSPDDAPSQTAPTNPPTDTPTTPSTDTSKTPPTNTSKTPPTTLPKTPSTTTPTTPSMTNTADARPTCPDLGTWDSQAAQFEAEVLVRVNQARARGGTCGDKSFAASAPLASEPRLDCVARAFAKAMSDGDFFDHTGLDGSSPFDRMRKAGLTNFSHAGENISVGRRNPQEVVEAWLRSPGHCVNILGDYRLIGIGYYRSYWVQDFITLR